MKEARFSMAAAVGEPLQGNLAMKNQTRRNFDRVKPEVDLLGEFPKRINIRVKKVFGEIAKKRIDIKYDYMSKYCSNCKLQSHDEQGCYILHLELYEKKIVEKQGTKLKNSKKEAKSKPKDEKKEIKADKDNFQVQKNTRTVAKGRQI